MARELETEIEWLLRVAREVGGSDPRVFYGDDGVTIEVFMPKDNDSLEIAISRVPASGDRYVASVAWQAAGEDVARIGPDGSDIFTLMESVSRELRRLAELPT